MKINKEYTLVELDDTTTQLANGININNETQNRKDIVKGTVKLSHTFTEFDVVYFPLYAASAVPLGVRSFVVHNDDIYIWETDN